MKAVIISGGAIEDGFALGFFAKIKADYTVAADRGLEFCFRSGLRPDCIVGDFDSVRPEVIGHYRAQGGIPIHKYNPEKDATDTAIAVRKALEAGAEEIWFLGSTGSRLDHVLSNIFNLGLLRERGVQGWIADSANLITMPVGRKITIRKEEQFGKYVSFFPFRSEVRGLTLEGFKYPLKDYTLVQGDGGLSVSNEIAEAEARVSWREGTLLLVQSRD